LTWRGSIRRPWPTAPAGMFGKMAAIRGVELQCRALAPVRVIHATSASPPDHL